MPKGAYDCGNERLVSTVLTMDERMRVDAAGLGLFRAVHRVSVEELIADVRERRAEAIMISVRSYEMGECRCLDRFVREIPTIPTVALLSGSTEQTAGALLRLGNTGVKYLVDIRSSRGWSELRRYLVDELSDGVERYAVESVRKFSTRISPESSLFLTSVFRASRRVSSVRELASTLGVLPSTLMSRFFRSGLPSPKRYLATARLVRAAYLFESKAFSVANVANHLGYSSPQSFGRHVRTMMGMTAVAFRQRYTRARMMQEFEEGLIVPFITKLHLFKPPVG